MTYTIKLPQFEGPFDLLLFFIERDELDIYDIPVAKITNDFLEYIRQLERLNIDVAAEFILVAATLMRIKAKMLIPRKELDEEGNEIDPRLELVQKLLEYKSYKDILVELQRMESERLSRQNRGNVMVELQMLSNQALADAELENLTLFRLLQTYQDVLQKFHSREEKIIHTIVNYHYTIESSKDYLIEIIQKNKKIDAYSLFSTCENRLHAIFIFLALLELLQLELVGIEQSSERINDFYMTEIENDCFENQEQTKIT